MVDEMIGKRFGMLVVKDRAENYVLKSKPRRRYLCICDCGREYKIFGQLLRNGKRTSCGCIHRIESGNRLRTHGMTNTPEFMAWSGMLSRCFKETDPSYIHYGARGISVCEAWRTDFMSFFSHLGKRPSKKHSLDRIDVNGHYEPGNVRWATALQQEYNKRKTVYCEVAPGLKFNTRQIQALTGEPKHIIYKKIKRGQPLLPDGLIEIHSKAGFANLLVMPLEAFLALRELTR